MQKVAIFTAKKTWKYAFYTCNHVVSIQNWLDAVPSGRLQKVK